ncbi:TIR domain-containing protein [Aurantiacibacter hainanensis]|uniref:TIR domain-containing protein n=1 Tax=Aurantiacibacter hainanensis TaxID=3076114 RepID=UPI0030C77637
MQAKADRAGWYFGGKDLTSTDIFISYSREDHDKASVVASCLEREGYDVWWDDALHSGDSFDMVIEDHLNEAKAVVVLWSPRSVRSRWVRAEATSADRRRKLAPAIIEPCERPIIFELIHTADLSEWDNDPQHPAWLSFLRDLKRTMSQVMAQRGEVAAASDLPQEPPAIPDPVPQMDVPEPAGGDEDEGEAFEATQFFTSSSAPYRSVSRLLLIEQGKVIEDFEVGPLGATVGRVAPADIILDDRRISRRHCMIEVEGDDLVVTDLNSTNGTYVDGVRVSEPTRLPPGSVLHIGGIELLHDDGQSSDA